MTVWIVVAVVAAVKITVWRRVLVVEQSKLVVCWKDEQASLACRRFAAKGSVT